MPRTGGAAASSAAKVLPIDVPAVALSELNRLTGNFGDRALVGEGSYGRVYRATLATGEAAAVKMFDNGSSSGQSEAEFCEQVGSTYGKSMPSFVLSPSRVTRRLAGIAARPN
jgi:hypothetical protein